jgi:hypothetical protein
MPATTLAAAAGPDARARVSSSNRSRIRHAPQAETAQPHCPTGPPPGSAILRAL